MSDRDKHGFTDGEHNSGEHVSEHDIAQQDGISGWQGGVDEQATANADADDPDEPPVE